MSKTLIRSNNDSVQAVADLWEAMVGVIKKYQYSGRGFLYMKQGDNFMDYMGLDKLKELDGKEYLGIDDQVYGQLVDAVENKYNFDTEFVFVSKQTERDGTIKFLVNIGGLHPEGWKEYNSPEHIKKVEADKQLLMAQEYGRQLKKRRMGKGK